MIIIGILQARVASTRLPGKVLKPLLGVPMMLRQIERLRNVRRIDRLIVATSTAGADDAIAQLCAANHVECFRGKLDDVLDRFYSAALPIRPDHIVRLTADCPLTDSSLIDEVIEFYLGGNFDYASDALEPTFPDGLDVEVFRHACLVEAWSHARLPSQREHVTPFIHQQPQSFRIGSYRNSVDLSHLRWTVDEPADFELVRRIYEALYPGNPNFSRHEILQLLDDNPEWLQLNDRHVRNEGYQKSLAVDSVTGAHQTRDR